MKRVKFSYLADLWKEEKQHLVKVSTLAAYSLILQNHLLPYFGEMNDVKEKDVQQFIYKKLDTGLSKKTVRDMLVVLNMVLRYADRHGYMSFRNFELHFPTDRKKTDIAVFDKDAHKMILHYTGEHRSLRNLGIFICLNTGLRIGEVCALRWGDIDMNSGEINVCRTIQRIYLKTEKGARSEVVVSTPKTANSIRTLPMSSALMETLGDYRLKYRIQDHYVLTDSMKPIEPRTYRNYFKKVLRQNNLPYIKFHGMRHSFATRCVESNCDYKTLSVLMGHSNISTTLNLYVHPNKEQKKRCVEQMLSFMEN